MEFGDIHSKRHSLGPVSRYYLPSARGSSPLTAKDAEPKHRYGVQLSRDALPLLDFPCDVGLAGAFIHPPAPFDVATRASGPPVYPKISPAFTGGSCFFGLAVRGICAWEGKAGDGPAGALFLVSHGPHDDSWPFGGV